MNADTRIRERGAFFGRRKGHPLRAGQASVIKNLLPDLAIDLGRPAPPDFRTLFKLPVDAVRLEIGFGGGEHLVWQAEHHPHVGLIGCEPFEDGVVKVLTAVADKGLANIRLHADDARDGLRWLPAGSIGRAFILFPDPWPKKRHVKRRLVSTPTLDLLARVLRPGAELRVATDIGDYARTILLAVCAHAAFDWRAASPADWRARGADWPATRYETKAERQGRKGYFLRFIRNYKSLGASECP
jgi:tRNA (guanine-N7-)-methyltransferase